MKVSLNWLREFIPLEKTVAEISDLLTYAGVEVEGIETTGVDINKIVVAQILASEQHPNADRLSVCRVDDGSGTPRQIVCGAKNYKVGDKVPLALPGAVLPGDFKIKVGKLRGVESEGMLCSARELAVSEESAGLFILPADSPVGAPIRELFPADTVFELEVTPNRPDLLSLRGIARELGAITGVETTPERAFETPGKSPFLIRIENPEACPWYSGRIIRGVKVGPSPEWMRKHLEASGLRPINNVVDVTNLVMLELGEPLHAFDLAQIDRGIVVRPAREGEKMKALDGRDYELTSADLLIADESKSLAIAGVMGGENSGVTEATTDILLEAALFSPRGIRRTSRRLGLSSDASYRFERGVDPAILLRASTRATALIEEIACGVAEKSIAIEGQLPLFWWEVSLRYDRCRLLMGVWISDTDIDQILTRLGLQALGNEKWSVPSSRADLTREVDLIEEVVRIYGVQNIPAKNQGFVAPVSAVDNAYDFQLRIKQRLIDAGFFESRTRSMRGEIAPVDEAFRTAGAMRVRNPLTEDQTFFRESLVPGLLEVADYNQRMGVTSIRLLETGRIFRAGQNEEKPKIALLITGDSGIADWRTPVRPVDFFDLKAAVSGILRSRTPIEFVKTQAPYLFLGAELVSDDKSLGWIGQITPDLVRRAGLKTPVFAAELDLAALQSVTDGTRRFQPLDRFPAVTRDVALIVPDALSHAVIEQTLASAKEPLLRSVHLFDVFLDPTGKKSLAYSLTYRAADRTLTQDEVNAAHQRLKTRLVENCGVSLRE
ncbi:MAG TPA: phenylalanine--tRNA ligase subunit beta [Chthoniobacterales bacterium]